jgi:hypothetical protein
MDISTAFLLLGYVRLEDQQFKLEVEKIVPDLLGEGSDVLSSYQLIFATTFLYSETCILCS